MSVLACLLLPSGAMRSRRARTRWNGAPLHLLGWRRAGLPQEGTPSFRAGRKQKCHCARGLLNSFEAAGPIARPSYRMKSLRPMRFFEINRPATDLKCRRPAGAAENLALRAHVLPQGDPATPFAHRRKGPGFDRSDRLHRIALRPAVIPVALAQAERGISADRARSYRF